MRGPAAIGLIVALVLGGCQQSAGVQSGAGGEVVVFAAASLQDAFNAMSSGLKDKATYNFGGSQVLATQLSQGAQADVFASADARNMKAAVDAGAVISGTQKVLATNRLVVITPSGSQSVRGLQDLARPGLKLVVADPSVPVGGYTLEVLDKLSADPAFGQGFKDRVLANVVSRENNVRQVLAKVQLGEADAGVVYSTDARAGQKPVTTIDIPDRYNVIASYYVAPVKDAPHPGAGARFIDYALSSDGQKVLSRFGFGPPGEGK